jgi:hypothetical protein
LTYFSSITQAQLIIVLQVPQTIVTKNSSINILYSSSIYHWELSAQQSMTYSRKVIAEIKAFVRPMSAVKDVADSLPDMDIGVDKK